jgi:HK97 family phage prohead protease
MPAVSPYRKTTSRVKQFTHTIGQLKLVDAVDAEGKRAEGSELPDGVCGRIQGTAMVYDQLDWYGTMFAPGCMARSINERVAARKVNLFLDHDKEVRCHVGIVSSMTDVGDSAIMTADILDTADGRLALEYCKAVIAAGGETGISIGFIPRKGEAVKDAGGVSTGNYRFIEIELREESITPVPAVEGALITGARREDDEDPEVMIVALRSLLSALPKERLDATLLEYGFQRSASETPTPKEEVTPPAAADPAAAETPAAEGEGSRKMSIDERIKALRGSFGAAV